MSPERARVMREAGERFDRAEAAKRAEKQVSISRMNRTLAHPNPVVRGLAGRLLTPNSRPGGTNYSDASSRGGRAANAVSKNGATVMTSAAEGKAASPGNPSRFGHLAAAGDTSRFAAFAAASDAGEAALEAVPAHPAGGSPEQAAEFIMASAAKARGQKVAAPVTPPVAVHDMTTPQGIADFVGASALKARGNRR